MFIHDALSELVVCGETDIPVASIRINISRLQKLVVGEAITGFQKQFKVIKGGVYDCAKRGNGHHNLEYIITQCHVIILHICRLWSE